jgi:hypothetical protein
VPTEVAALIDGVDRYFHSSAWLVTRNLALFFAVLFWLAIAWWVMRDARRRIEDPWLIAASGVVGLALPYVGALVYLLFRPAEPLDDIRERELEMRTMEERLGVRLAHCPRCRAGVESTFLVCPICTTRLKRACTGCRAPLEPLWQLCPYCETPADAPAAAGVTSLTRRPAANE